MAELTLKQEHFAKAYIETGNASEAYRIAYDADKMKAETIHRKANELISNGKITARIEEMQKEHQERHKITVDNLVDQLEEALQLAKTNGNANAMIAAIMGKAKLLGLDKPEPVRIQIEKELPTLAELFAQPGEV